MTTVDDGNIDGNTEDEVLEFEEEAFEDFEESSSGSLADAVTQITERVLDTIEGASAVRAGFFFPNGIDLIEVTVDIDGVKASVKIAGPKVT